MNAPSHRPIDYAHHFPWTRLFRAFRIATDPRKLALAAAAITVFWCGEAVLFLLPSGPPREESPAAPWDSTVPALFMWSNESDGAFYDDPASHSLSLASRVVSPVRPLFSVVALPFVGDQSWAELAFAWTRLFWALAVWSVFGGAIARLAALEFARDERGGLWQALKFSLRRFIPLYSAPLLPLIGVFGLWAICAIGGLVGRLPYVGEWIVAIGWGLAAALGLLIVLIAVATTAGWPLMVAAVATENSDGFDGFSRAFSYLYGRPWLYLWCASIALLTGMLLVAVVDTATVGLEIVAARAVASGVGDETVAELHALPPGYFEATAVGSFAEDAPVTGPTRIAAAWLAVIATVAVGFAASYFWTAATIIYFLLRRADDATHLDEVWLNEIQDTDDLIALAGIASTDQPVVERPHQPTVGPPVTTA